MLQYKGDHNSLGYWYNWIKYKERFDKETNERELVRCGDSLPLFWPDSPEGPCLGYVDNKTEIAMFSINKKVFKKMGGELNDMMLIVRELKGGPPGCECAGCGKKPVVRVMLNEWADFRMGDPWPTKKMVQVRFAFAYLTEYDVSHNFRLWENLWTQSPAKTPNSTSHCGTSLESLLWDVYGTRVARLQPTSRGTAMNTPRTSVLCR